MGLDNGIMVKDVSHPKAIARLSKWRDPYYKNEIVYEICYWRKCWNVRNSILDICEDCSDNDYDIILSITDVKKILDYLKSLNREAWESEDWCNSSIWSWDEHKNQNKKHIKALKDLLYAMKKDPDMTVYFYDSY